MSNGKKRKIVLIVTDQTDIEELKSKIAREYANHIWGHYIEIPINSPPIKYPPYYEDYADGDEG
jgi:hypothetical protein